MALTRTRCLSIATEDLIRFVEARRAAHRTPTVVSPMSRIMSTSSKFGISGDSICASSATPAASSWLLILVQPFFLKCGSPKEILSVSFRSVIVSLDR